jgi:predicted DNA-binding antitoxin AbrB/MazE fold protein
MTIHVDAVYEHGAFRPTVPVTIDEGSQVTLTIETDAPARDPQPLVAALAEIAGMPTEGCDDGFSGADHDELLYGPQGAR